MSNSQKTVFGYTHDETPVQYTVEDVGTEDERRYWQDVYGNTYAADEVTPVRTLAANEVAVSREVADRLVEYLTSGQGDWHPLSIRNARQRLRAALDATPAEPTAEDEAEEVTVPQAIFDAMHDANTGEGDPEAAAKVRAYFADPSPREAPTPGDEEPAHWDDTGDPAVWTEPARPSLPDTPRTTVRVTLRDLYSFPHSKNKPPTFVWRTNDTPHAWFWDEDPNNAVSTGDVARVTSVTVLAEPPKGTEELREQWYRGWYRGHEAATNEMQPAEQGDTGSDSWVSPDTEVPAVMADVKAAEDRAVQRAVSIEAAYRQAMRTDTDRKVAELREELTGDKEPQDIADDLLDEALEFFKHVGKTAHKYFK